MAKKKELRPLNVDISTLKKSIKDFCEENAYPNNCETSLLQAMDAMKKDETYSRRLLEPIDDYYRDKPIDFVKHTSFKKYFSSVNCVARKLEISNLPVSMAFYYCLLPKLREKYVKAGYSEKMFHDAVDFLRSKLYEGYRVYGVWGTFDAPNFSKIFTLERFGFGKLQYQIAEMPFSGQYNARSFTKGEKAIEVFIPSLNMPTREEYEQSLAEAHRFFSEKLGKQNLLFFHNSWLLFPPHRTFLEEGNPILTAMDLFHMIRVKKMRNNPDYWCVFNRFYKKDDKEALFIDKPLELGYDKYIKAGNCMGRGFGILFYDGETLI